MPGTDWDRLSKPAEEPDTVTINSHSRAWYGPAPATDGDGPYPAFEEPRTMTITMLGKSKSGKTTYILGMYAELVHGFRGCNLHTQDEDAGVEMVNQLTRLRGGDDTPATGDRGVPHNYVLNSPEGQVPVDLEDFRGEAPFRLARGDDRLDTTKIRKRLAGSHAIFVALDSTYFVEPVTRGRVRAVQQETGADLFSDLINKTVADHQGRHRPPPSVAVLLTKADLLDGRPGSVARRWEDVEAEIREVLGGAAFDPNVSTRIMPVHVEGFGALLDGPLSNLSLRVCAPADPMIFAAATFFKVRQAAVQRQHQQALKNSAGASKNLDELTAAGSFVRWLRRNKIAAAQAELTRSLDRVNELDARWKDLAGKADVMMRRIGPTAGTR